jgi:membrane protein involved in D-alanine export
MFKFSNILPFSDSTFYYFIGFSILFIFVLKIFLTTKIKYPISLFLINCTYLLVLFPKPIHFLIFLLYGYIIFRIFGIKLKKSGVIPILLYVIPLILMKTINVFPQQENLEFSLLENLFQIAGLSYATFKMIQLYIDDKENVQAKNFINYFNFIAFTPTLLIGPIDRFKRFQNNVDLGYSNLNSTNFNKGFTFFIKGLVYKYIFAFAISSLILAHLSDDNSMFYHFSYMYTYIFYLFFDFAGYSLLAMGFGYMLGIQVPFNFDKPFLARNPREFWQKWHKTLGDWLNDYFFKPIFKELTSRKVLKPIQRQSIALFITFLLMGFWNGFELKYIISGALFGIYSVIHNYYSYLCKKNKKEMLFKNANENTIKWLSIVILFNFVSFSIYIFSGNLF